MPAAARALGWAVVANNVEALKILLGCSYGAAAVLATAGAFARWAVGAAVLWCAGLEGEAWAGTGSVTAGKSSGRGAEVGIWDAVLYLRDWAGRLAVG